MQTKPDNVIEIFLARYIKILAIIWHGAEKSYVPRTLVLNDRYDYYDNKELLNFLEAYNVSAGGFDSLADRITHIIYPTVYRRLKRSLEADSKKFGTSANTAGAMMLADTLCREIYPSFLETALSANDVSPNAVDDYGFAARELRACPPIFTPSGYEYIEMLIADLESALEKSTYIRLLAKRFSPGPDGALVSLDNRIASITASLFAMIDYAELKWPQELAEEFIKSASVAISNTLERILEMESPENSSPTLARFLEQTGFLAEVPSGINPELEAKVNARLIYCVRELSEITGLDLSNFRTPGEAAVIALKKGKSLEETSGVVAAAVEDCIAILDMGSDQD